MEIGGGICVLLFRTPVVLRECESSPCNRKSQWLWQSPGKWEIQGSACFPRFKIRSQFESTGKEGHVLQVVVVWVSIGCWLFLLGEWGVAAFQEWKGCLLEIEISVISYGRLRIYLQDPPNNIMLIWTIEIFGVSFLAGFFQCLFRFFHSLCSPQFGGKQTRLLQNTHFHTQHFSTSMHISLLSFRVDCFVHDSSSSWKRVSPLKHQSL